MGRKKERERRKEDREWVMKAKRERAVQVFRNEFGVTSGMGVAEMERAGVTMGRRRRRIGKGLCGEGE